MSETPLDAAVAFQTLRLLVPSRSYVIDYEVLGERFLPLVEEFLLRAVATTGSLDPKVAAQFLGLTDRECAKCLDALEQQRLVALDADGRLELSPYARERLRNPDGVPRFVEVEAKQTVFAVDLISFQSGPSAADSRDMWREHAIELEERPRPDLRQQDLVRAAFEGSFYEMNRGTPRRSPPDAHSPAKTKLHRVRNIVGRRYFTWPFDVDVVVWAEDHLRCDFPFSQYSKTSEVEARRDLFNALRGTITKFAPAPAPTRVPGFQPLLEGTPAITALQGDQIDESFLVRLGQEHVGDDSDPVFFVGDFSQERVEVLWRNQLQSAFGRLGGSAKVAVQPLIWLPPEGGLWARSDAVRVGLETAKAVLGYHNREMGAVLLVPTSPDGTPKTTTPQRHRSAFPIARSVDSSRWPSNIEVVLLPGRVAALFFHMRPNGSCVVPVVAGFMTSDKDRLEVIEKLMSGLLNPAPSNPRRDWCNHEQGVPAELLKAIRSVMWEGD